MPRPLLKHPSGFKLGARPGGQTRRTVTRTTAPPHMDTFTALHTHKAVHEVNVRHFVDVSPTALSLAREARTTVIAVAICITTIIIFRTAWSNSRGQAAPR